MEADWRPINELRPGHYAVGRLDDGMEIDIYRDGARILNVATGMDAEGVSGWRRGGDRSQRSLQR